MNNWFTLTPEYQTMVILISSPVAMIVALWGMTSKRALELMKSGHGKLVTAGDDATKREVIFVGSHKGKGIAVTIRK